MHPDNDMKRIVDGKRYAVKTAKLLASDEYWNGSNWDRNGHNTFLYKTRGGAFFRVDLTCWTGERDMLEPVTRSEAMELYEELQEHDVEYEEAFDTVVEEASAGRPPIYDEKMRQTAVWLTEDQITWLKSQNATMGETIRKLIDAARS